MPLLPSPQDCCNPCPTPTTTNIPGTPGADGAPGAAGASGLDAFTTVTSPFTMPAEGATVDVAVAQTGWMVPGQKVFVGVAGGAARGTFEVVVLINGQLVTLVNLANVAAGQYAENSPEGTVFPVGSGVSPSGLQGAAGAAGGGGASASAAFIVSTPTAPAGSLPNETALSAFGQAGLLRTDLAGALTIVLVGTANANIAPVDDAGGLTPGEALFATPNGMESLASGAAQAALGLGSMATQAANSVNISGGVIGNVTITGGLSGSFLTLTAGTLGVGKFSTQPTALQTLGPANVIAPSGKVRVVSSGGAVVLTSTPTVALGAIDGDRCRIMGTSDTDTVELQDDGSLAGSKLRLGAANRVLGAGDSLDLDWDAASGFWNETGFTALV